MKRIWFAILAAGVLAGCGSKTPHEALMEAEGLFESNDINGAIQTIQELQKQNLDDVIYANSQMLLGKYYLYSNDMLKTRETFRDVFDRFGVENPNPVLADHARGAAINVALSYLEAQPPDPATSLDFITATSATLTRSPEFSRQLSRLAATVLSQLDRRDEAFAELQRLLQTSANSAEQTDIVDQMAFIRIEQQQWDDAARAYLDVADKSEDILVKASLYMRAGVYCFPGQNATAAQAERKKQLLDAAYRMFEEGRRQTTDPSHQCQILIEQSTAAWANGKKTVAIDHLTSVVERLEADPNVRATALQGLAEFCMEESDFDGAKRYYERMKQEFPQMAAYAMQGIVSVDNRIAELAILGPDAKTAAADAGSTPTAAIEAAPAAEPLTMRPPWEAAGPETAPPTPADAFDAAAAPDAAEAASEPAALAPEGGATPESAEEAFRPKAIGVKPPQTTPEPPASPEAAESSSSAP